jgi:hypothetical protein
VTSTECPFTEHCILLARSLSAHAKELIAGIQ